MRPLAVLAVFLLFACSHGESTAAPSSPPAQPRSDFIDRSRPAGGVRAAAMTNVAAAVDAQYRITPDRRALIAVADVHELLAGTRVRPEINFAGGMWTVSVDGRQIGSLTESPQFMELVDFLTRYASSLQVASESNSIQLTEFAAPAVFTAAKAFAKPADAAASLGHAAVAINMQTIDRFGLADPVRSRALAVLAIARATKSKDIDGDVAILADLFGYEGEARALVSELPADALARAWVLRTKPVQSGAASAYVQARNEVLAAVGLDRGDAARAIAKRLPARALPVLIDNPGFGYGAPLSFAAAAVVAAEVSGDDAALSGTAASTIENLREGDLRKIVSVFETALPGRSEELASSAFPREVINAYYQALFFSALHGIFSSEFETYGSRERTEDVIGRLANANSDVATQVRQWMQSSVAAKYESGRGTNAQAAIAATPLLGPLMHTKLLRAFRDRVGADDRHVRLALHDVFPRLDSRPAEMSDAGGLAHSILGDVMRRDRYVPLALQRSRRDGSGREAWYYSLAGDADQLRRIADANDTQPADRAVALSALSELPGADHAYITKTFEKLLASPGGHEGAYSTFAAYINGRRDWKAKERVVRQWMAAAEADELPAEAYYASSLAHALEMQGKYEEAWAVIEPLIPVWSANIITAAVSVLERRGEVDEAISLANDLIERYPDAGSRAALATVYWRRGRHAEAADVFHTRHGLHRSSLRRDVSKAFMDTFNDRPQTETVAAFVPLARGGADLYLVRDVAFDIRTKLGKPQLAFELVSAAANALQLDAATTEGTSFYLEGWSALKEWKGADAANEWIRPRITAASVLQLGVVAYQLLADELLTEMTQKAANADQNIQILSLRAGSLVRGRVAKDDPRRVAMINEARALGDRPDSLLPAVQYLMDMISEDAYLRGGKTEDDRVVVAYFVGLKNAARGDYEAALPWLIYASEGRPANPARAWAAEMLWRWAKARKPWPEIKRSGLL